MTVRLITAFGGGTEVVAEPTASHHWRVLRESGLVHQQREGRHLHMSLRREDLESRFPGLLDAVLNGLEQQEDSSSPV